MNLTEDNSGFIRKMFMHHVGSSVAAQIVSTIGPIVCGAIAGTAFGKTGLAVTGLFSPFFFLAGFFGTIIAGGSTALAAKYVANGENERVIGIFTLAILWAVVCAALMCFVLLIFKEPVIKVIAGDKELMEYARRFYVPFIWYVFFTVIVNMPLSWSRLLGKPEIALVLMVTMTGVNIITAVLFICVMKMGLESLAVSQALSTVIAIVVSFIMLHLSKSGLRLKKPGVIRNDIKSMLLLGSPLGLSRLYRFIDILALNFILLSAVGAEAVAVYGIMNMLLRFVTAFCNGISGVQMPIAGVLKEEHDTESLKQLSRMTFVFGNAAFFTAAVLLFIMRGFVASIFGISADGYMFNYALVCFCLYIPFYANGTLIISWYTAVRRVAPANYTTFAQDMLLLPLFAALLTKTGSGSYVWLHMPFAGIAMILFLPVMLFLMRKQYSELTFPLLLEKSSEKPALAFSVDIDTQKVNEASAAVGDFCREQGLGKKQSMLLSMAIEEFITLTAAHRVYNVKKVKHTERNDEISVRLLFFDNNIILRLRVGGKKFNPIEFYDKRMKSGKDIEELVDLIGIKYIVEAAKAVSYTETFGVNNLVVII